MSSLAWLAMWAWCPQDTDIPLGCQDTLLEPQEKYLHLKPHQSTDLCSQFSSGSFAQSPLSLILGIFVQVSVLLWAKPFPSFGSSRDEGFAPDTHCVLGRNLLSPSTKSACPTGWKILWASIQCHSLQKANWKHIKDVSFVARWMEV